MFTDHILRIQDGEVRTGGIPEAIWFGITTILAIPSAFLAWKGTKPLGGMLVRLIVLTFQLIFGFIVYSMIALWYIVGTGIDSL